MTLPPPDTGESDSGESDSGEEDVIGRSSIHGFADATALSSVMTDWVLPVDNDCPASHPVKANDDSGIYHLPGGRFYERTIAERCYSTAEAAEADGYRQAKV